MSESEASAPTSGVPRAVLLALSAAYVALGVAFLMAPAKMAAFADLSTTSKLGLIELRAFYGGGEIGLGVFLAVTAMRREWQLPGLLAALLSLLGIAAARIYGMTAEGWPGATVLLFLALELGGVVAAGFGLMRIKRDPRDAALDSDIAVLQQEKTQLIEKTKPIERTVRLESSKSDRR